jgi:hypothetical protein
MAPQSPASAQSRRADRLASDGGEIGRNKYKIYDINGGKEHMAPQSPTSAQSRRADRLA